MCIVSNALHIESRTAKQQEINTNPVKILTSECCMSVKWYLFSVKGIYAVNHAKKFISMMMYRTNDNGAKNTHLALFTKEKGAKKIFHSQKEGLKIFGSWSMSLIHSSSICKSSHSQMHKVTIFRTCVASKFWAKIDPKKDCLPSCPNHLKVSNC